MRKNYQGKYRLVNESKYLGDKNNVIYRSSWELAFLKFCDKNSSVKEFSSEEIVIPYISPKDGRQHRYFPDFFVKFQNNEKVIIEIKPSSECREPVPPKKKTQKALNNFLNAIETYQVNQAKWKFAEEFCTRNGMKFVVFTEQDLRALDIPVLG